MVGLRRGQTTNATTESVMKLTVRKIGTRWYIEELLAGDQRRAVSHYPTRAAAERCAHLIRAEAAELHRSTPGIGRNYPIDSWR